MFEAIKKKYKNICDLQKEIEKINKKWKIKIIHFTYINYL